MPTVPRNPYIAGKALIDSRGFFGREDVFRLVDNVFSSPDQNSVVLFGQRRIGKTSILLNLRSRLSSSSFVPVYFDLMDRARKPLADVLYDLASTITQALNLEEIPRRMFDHEGDFLHNRFLPSLHRLLGEQKRLVLLFDEFDVLGETQVEQLPMSAAEHAFFPYLRKLMRDYPRLGFVFAVGRKVDELGGDFKMTFKASRYYRVSVLDHESAEALVRCAEQFGYLRFADDAVSRILTLTACHPYFTQLACQILFDRKHREPMSGNSNNIVQVEDVENNIPRILEAGQNVFEWIWDGLPPAERVIFSAIATGTDEKTLVTYERIADILRSQGIRQLLTEFELGPKTLVEWDMLKAVDGGFKFLIELMRRWVLEVKPLSKVKNELNRVVPRADTLYQEAKELYDKNYLADAIPLLKNVLNTNRYHLKARLLLAEIYRAQGNLEGAVYELGIVSNIDEESSFFPLVRTLLARAKKWEEEGDNEKALKDYDWVLTLSPENVNAKLRHNAIWYNRGEKALDATDRWNQELNPVDMEKAINAFREADALDRVAELEQRKLNVKIGEQAQLADDLARNEQWQEAGQAYRQLLAWDSRNPRWAKALTDVTRELKVTNAYSSLILWWIVVSVIGGTLGGILGCILFARNNTLVGAAAGDLVGFIIAIIQWIRFKKDLLKKSFALIGLSLVFTPWLVAGFFSGGMLNTKLGEMLIPELIKGTGIVVGFVAAILLLLDQEAKLVSSLGWFILALVLGWLSSGMIEPSLWNVAQGILLIAALTTLVNQTIVAILWRLLKVF